MKRKIVIALMILLCFLLQSTVFQALAIGSISPNLMIILTASFGFMGGRKEGRYFLWKTSWHACNHLYVHRLWQWTVQPDLLRRRY